jgi:hypothetical protein
MWFWFILIPLIKKRVFAEDKCSIGDFFYIKIPLSRDYNTYFDTYVWSLEG